MDKLTNRLRGQYSVGPENIYGTRSFADFIPPISLEAANRIEELEAMLRFLVDNDSINDSSIDEEVKQVLCNDT